MNDHLLFILRSSERVDQLINGRGGQPHSFEVNSLVGYIHYNALALANIDSEEKAVKNNLNIYLKDGSRFYVKVPD